MASPSTSPASGTITGRLRVLLEMVKWEHTVFALPFAYAGMLAAMDEAVGRIVEAQGDAREQQ